MFSNWRRAQKLPDKAPSALQARGAERTNELEQANQDLKAGQAELQKRWQHLAEAQKLSHSGTFGWKVHTGGAHLVRRNVQNSGFHTRNESDARSGIRQNSPRRPGPPSTAK